MEDIEGQMRSSDPFPHNPAILPRDRGAILARRMIVQRIAGEQGGAGAEAAE